MNEKSWKNITEKAGAMVWQEFPRVDLLRALWSGTLRAEDDLSLRMKSSRSGGLMTLSRGKGWKVKMSFELLLFSLILRWSNIGEWMATLLIVQLSPLTVSGACDLFLWWCLCFICPFVFLSGRADLGPNAAPAELKAKRTSRNPTSACSLLWALYPRETMHIHRICGSHNSVDEKVHCLFQNCMFSNF